MIKPKVRPHFALLALPVLAVNATASSHREAPFVTENPKVDATDFYMFNSYEAGHENFVTAIANYQPLQDPYGGPNYFKLDSEAIYDIHFDNDGDAVEDLTFRFRFFSRFRNKQLLVGAPGQEISVPVALRNIGAVSAGNLTNVNDPETFSAWVIEGPVAAPTSITQLTETGTGAKRFKKPLDNIGTKSIPNYDVYANAHIFDVDLPGGLTGRMFVGQREDPFFVDLGGVFDLVNLDPLGPPNAKPNTLADKSVTSLALELPKAFLVDNNPVIGSWTTSSLPRTRVLVADPSFQKPMQTSSDFVQVSRLGMPLVNEVVIGLGDKNRFNESRPFNDGQFIDYVTNPTLPELLEALFGVTAPNLFPRFDLTEVFLTGLSGLNQNGSVGEMLRLNTDIPAVAATAQKTLGVLDGDLAGFPNGRRPGDDVVDIELRVVMGVLLNSTLAPDGGLPFTDGVASDATQFDQTFPYLNSPKAGAQ